MPIISAMAQARPATTSHREVNAVRRAMFTVVSVNTAAIRMV